MATTFTRENYNAREEILSSDLNRQQRLQSRDLQDLLQESARGPEGPITSGGNYANATPAGPVINGLEKLPTLTAGAGFTVNLGDGSGFLYDAAITGDDSTYQVVRWPAQSLTLANPDNTNPRIDLIVATPAEVTSDPVSRNILVDPTLRTVAAQTVNKTAVPLATVTVVTGTPAVNPVAPAVPVGALPLFEVAMLANAVDATAFLPARRTNRRIDGPMAACHGVIQGCQLSWGSIVDEATTGSTILIAGGNVDANRAIIDGELIQFGPNFLVGTGPSPFADSSNNPFTAGVVANNDVPYYIYLVGGRNAPQLTIGSPPAPACLVESLTPPLASGYPSAAIATPRGTTQRGALYIGVGWVVKNSHFRKGCRVSGDWVYAQTGSYLVGVGHAAGFNDLAAVASPPADPNVHALTLASKPALSTHALIGVLYKNTSAADESTLWVGTGTSAATFNAEIIIHRAKENSVDYSLAQAEMDVSPGTVAYSADVLFATASVKLFAKAYNMRVPRLGR